MAVVPAPCCFVIFLASVLLSRIVCSLFFFSVVDTFSFPIGVFSEEQLYYFPKLAVIGLHFLVLAFVLHVHFEEKN